MSNKTVLITGCSSGFGKLAAKKFHECGWNVVATMRSPENELELKDDDRMMITGLDVSDGESIVESVELCIERFGGIDVLVNNAGYGGHAMFEQFEESQIYDMFETNVFGAMRVTRTVLPHMRKQKQGCIINVTSMAGVVGLPFASTYSSSKFALEGWSEGLALECVPFNIKVRTVAPGAFGTNFVSATVNNLRAGDEELCEIANVMMKHFSNLTNEMLSQGGELANPQDVADIIYDCATSEMPTHNVIGADAKMLMGLKSSMSQQGFLDKMAEMLLPA